MRSKWQTKTLGEVCDILDSRRRPITKSDRVSGEYPYYGATGILDYVEDYIFDEKLVLIGEDGAKWNAGENTAFIVEEKYWVNNHAHVVRPHRDTIIDEWLVYYLNACDLSEYITGVTVPKLNQAKMRSIKIPIPPLPEQKHIVSILDEAFAAIEEAKENAEKNLQNAKDLFESYSENIFKKEGDSWMQVGLGDKEFLQIIDGDRGANYPKKSDFSEEGYCLFLNTKNVLTDGFDFSSVMFISEEKDLAMGKGKLQRNDIVLTTRGTIGNIGLYSEDVSYDSVRINSGMLIFRPKIEKILPEYVFEIFRSGLFKRQIKEHVSGAAQPQLPIKSLVKFNIPVPISKDDQAKMVLELQHGYFQSKELQSLYTQKLSALDELKQSLLRKAFNAEL
ncbi:hypothetical protein COU78_01770 [Candidatus Peregrinibacteria bacterium CG10_big_fil_rev_8_21_14_0_10_49_24]|nr:MAG: hypothetical protein COV83_00405 [Candidatus Peregrinibacteria bacterium CG11_big_fil_rev_8_21_14_0_20_49_14]PIR51448.1 MAG: hypothetical protein COU78_01770 [Candidatus Peregrinibacteria bacterium CG10_big_fil_rev_8_21_14_0_10_49_24]PJA67384.1 MAG: hypothetical protein CO157_05000 [Candidatus Peregrinibacteria bacterium CG_4_9_14_3_um_filter_49_12]